MRVKQRVVIDVIEFKKLFIILEAYLDDGGNFWEAIKAVEVMRVKFQSLNNHLLGEDHQNEMLKPSTNDHIFDSSSNELF